MTFRRIPLILVAMIAVVLQGTASQAQDVGMEEAGAVEWSSDQQELLSLFLGDVPARLEIAEHDLLDAQLNQQVAAAGGTATPEELAAMEAELRAAQEARAAVLAEIYGFSDLIAQLNGEQVDALTRSLRNAVASGLGPPLDAAQAAAHDTAQQIAKREARLIAKASIEEAIQLQGKGAAKKASEELN